MHPYVLLLCVACLVSAGSAGYVLQSKTFERAGRLAASLMMAAAFWTMCEVLWNLAPDADTAVRLMRLSALGFGLLGPIVLHLFLEVSQVHWPRMRKLLLALYAACAGVVLLAWVTPWVFSGAVRTSWGWGYVSAPGHGVLYLLTLAGVLPAIAVVQHAFRNAWSPAERRQRPWIFAGIGAPLVVASLTDAILPLAGVQVPRLGTLSFALLGVIAVSNVRHFGYSFLTPGTFSEEIIETLPDGVALLQWDERIRTANLGLARLSGHPREELIGLPIGELLSWSFGGQLEDADEVECELSRSSGDRIPVSAASSVLRDRQSNPVGLVLVVRDLREVADLRSRLVRSARLAAVGELAAGIAHEINNPLAFVRANLSQLEAHWKLLAEGMEAGDETRELEEAAREGEEIIAESLEGVDRAAEIVRGVRGFSHAGGGERVASDLNRLLEDVVHMAEAELRSRACIERDFAELPEVLCAPQELRQVFLNLVLNAGHAIEDGGSIWIETRVGLGDVTVAVEDDGCGIPEEIIDRIFDPFFTTKKIGEGTGLGLGIAYRIIRSHDGEIEVESEPGKGTRFTVRLPTA